MCYRLRYLLILWKTGVNVSWAAKRWSSKDSLLHFSKTGSLLIHSGEGTPAGIHLSDGTTPRTLLIGPGWTYGSRYENQILFSEFRISYGVMRLAVGT